MSLFQEEPTPYDRRVDSLDYIYDIAGRIVGILYGSAIGFCNLIYFAIYRPSNIAKNFPFSAYRRVAS